MWLLVGLGLAALGFALLAGGRQERIYVAAKAASTVGDLAIASHPPGDSVGHQAIIDLALLAVVLPLALKSTKVWPLAAASLCVAALMTEAAQTLVHAAPQAYGIAKGVWELLADIVVAVGAWNAWRARRRGADRAPQRTADPA